MKLFGEKGSSDFYGEMFRGEKGLLSTNLVSVFPFTDVLIWSVSKNKMCCQYFPKCSSRTSPPPKKKTPLSCFSRGIHDAILICLLY